MLHVVTLVSHPAHPALRQEHMDALAAHLPAGASVHWLAPHIAADLSVPLDAALDKRQLADHLRASLKGAALDVIVQPAEGRRKKLFLADMDSTMIGQECIDELADFAGMKSHVAAITERAMRGEIEFEPALRERVALLKGLEADIIERVYQERIRLTSGARELIGTMRAHGTYTARVSGGFTLFTQKVAAALGFDEHRGNRLIVEDDRFAGTVADPILGREAKLTTLISLRDAHKLSHDQTMAVGDGANDLAMLQEAGLGIAYHAKPAVAQAAHVRIDHADLTALLYMQGYNAADFSK